MGVGLIYRIPLERLSQKRYGCPQGCPRIDMEGIDKTTFKRIFRDHWAQFKETHPRYDSEYYDQVIQKMLDCGDPERMGFVQYRCCSCGEFRKSRTDMKSSWWLISSGVPSTEIRICSTISCKPGTTASSISSKPVPGPRSPQGPLSSRRTATDNINN